MDPVYIRTAHVTREREQLRRIASTVAKLVLFLGGAALPLIGRHDFFEAFVGVCSLTLAFFVSSRVIGAGAWRIHGDVLVEDGVLRIGPRRFPLSTVRGVLLRGGGERPIVEIDLASGDRLLVVPSDADDAARLAEALGREHGGGLVRLRASDGWLRSLVLAPVSVIVGTFVAGFLLAGLMMVTSPSSAVMDVLSFALWAASVLGVYELFKRLNARPHEVIVGDDGFLVRRRKTVRFIRWSEVTRVVSDVLGKPRSLVLRGDREVAIDPTDADYDRWRAVMDLLGARGAEASRAAATAAPFERGTRDLATWRKHLQRELDGGGSYRAAGITLEEAEAALRSPVATPEQRIGAAIALRVAGEPPARVRVAAEAVADATLREALLGVADDDDGRAERAFRALK